MGIFDIFKKKVPALLQQQVTSPPLDKNVYVMQTLKAKLIEMGYKAAWHPQYLAVIVNDQLKLATMIIEASSTHPSLMQMMVMASHQKYFPNGIMESVVGTGHSIEQKVSTALDNFINITFVTIIDSFSDTHDPALDFTAITNGQEALWHPKLGTIHYQGEWAAYPENEILFEMLKDKIPGLVTLNKINWLKIYISKMKGGEILGECNFNNQPWEDGSTLLDRYAESWQLPGEFQGAKQFIMFRRCDLYD